MNLRPLILITNDDGYQAPGLHHLTQLMKTLGDVVVISSEQTMSAMSHAITIKVPLVFRCITDETGFKEFVTNGTPADCVKLGLHKIVDRKPSLVVSGINHGSNSSINIIYSGTLAGALEAAMGGIPAIGFSIRDYSLQADFSHTDSFILHWSRYLLENNKPTLALNINFPKVTNGAYKGHKICRQAKAYWKEDFEERLDPRSGKPYYWLKGDFLLQDDGHDTDEWALNNYFVSVVPVQYDFTDFKSIDL
ncbi:MAG: 5'/3'-nucleotidase SurE, partial [Bacteroidales bacterium]|nr:5'/3'-nucleotidase SurE [Bacteroidales bacterium]